MNSLRTSRVYTQCAIKTRRYLLQDLDAVRKITNRSLPLRPLFSLQRAVEHATLQQHTLSVVHRTRVARLWHMYKMWGKKKDRRPDNIKVVTQKKTRKLLEGKSSVDQLSSIPCPASPSTLRNRSRLFSFFSSRHVTTP